MARDRSSRLLAAALIVLAAAALPPVCQGAAVTHRVIPADFLNLGNRWGYQVHVTIDDNAPADWWGTETWEVVRTQNVAGFNTSVMERQRSDGDGETSYWFLTPQALVDARSEDEDSVDEVRNGDPTELLPVRVSESDTRRHIGHGQYWEWEKADPSDKETWYGDTYVTFLRRETITVPAGAFDCVVVRHEYELSYGDGSYDGQVHTFWMNPVIGFVKLELLDWYREPDGKEHRDASTLELTSTNVPIPQMELEPSSDLDFGPVTTGDVRTIQDAYTVKNAGTGRLDVTVSVAAPFHVVPPVSFALAEGEERSVSFDFAPTAGGPVSRTIYFSANGAEATRTAVGVGVLPVPTKSPVVTTRCPTLTTACPVAQTSCPPLDTVCPKSPTACPPVATRCPVEETQCPTLRTACPATTTRCPASATECPPSATRCPAAETQCPRTSTACPPSATRCPAEVTVCPTRSTRCPEQETRCPAEATVCPTRATGCPNTDTLCPAERTVCPPSPTRCQIVDTTCPALRTVCPETATKCPSDVTACPPGATKCPPADTQCPRTTTACPPSATRCPAESTQCPAARTACPSTTTKCPAETTHCPIISTKCPPMGAAHSRSAK